jgi:uncharacterized YigZ family protein
MSAPDNDAYLTLKSPAEGAFKDRGSKFLGFAFPVRTEQEALDHLAVLRKVHFKANHHCYAWRLGREGNQFRANDDGEPSGTAGRPILAQIDAAQLTDVLVVVVRYFGGTLLGASGLINAYRTTAQATLQTAEIAEIVLRDTIVFDVEYACLPDLQQAVHQLGITIENEIFGDRAQVDIAIRKRDTVAKLLQLKAKLWRVSLEEAATLDWPEGVSIIH